MCTLKQAAVAVDTCAAAFINTRNVRPYYNHYCTESFSYDIASNTLVINGRTT